MCATGRGSAGLSPPTRGSQAEAGRGDGSRGSIPAHAGKLPRNHRLDRTPGSIPAHAGKPGPQPSRSAPAPVYPRPRGEACRHVSPFILPLGLSPPTRGSHHRYSSRQGEYMSIPAHAGKPSRSCIASSRVRVYPRPRGEAGRPTRARTASSGLSPPTRGRPKTAAVKTSPSRSIPAHAGKPLGSRFRHWRTPVYPRPRGEASGSQSSSVFSWGLSPPTRGSRSWCSLSGRSGGSIPAHAGKPSS